MATSTDKPKKKRRGAGAAEAERIVQAWLELDGWTVHRAAATGFATFKKKDGSKGFAVKSHDLFGCLDLLAFRRNPGRLDALVETHGVQVTTQSGRSHRRAKLEVHSWPRSWRVSLVSHEVVPDVANRSRRNHFLKVEDLCAGEWSPAIAVPINMKAIEAHRSVRAMVKTALREGS